MHLRLGLLLLAFAPVAVRAGQFEFKVTDARGAAVPDAVVSLVPLDGPAPALKPATGVEIRQEKQEFVPYVTAVVVGTKVSLPNADDVEHHVYSLSPALKFSFPLYKPRSAKEVVFDKPGVVSIGCNIHDWMIAYVYVLETPWFGQTAAAGSAAVADVPAGRYRAEIRHPQLATPFTREIVVAPAGASESFTVTLRPDRRIRRPVDPKGGGYR